MDYRQGRGIVARLIGHLQSWSTIEVGELRHNRFSKPKDSAMTDE